MGTSYFITGTDTDVGKTLVARTLLLALAAPTLAAEPAPVVREQVGNRISENVPTVPAELVERLELNHADQLRPWLERDPAGYLLRNDSIKEFQP